MTNLLPTPSKPTPWHRLIGVSLTDVLSGLMKSTMELELGQSSQQLDFAAERITPEPLTEAQLAELPDGLQTLGDHNLSSFKSGQESLGEPEVFELFSYGVAYAKRTWSDGWRNGFTERRLRFFLIAVRRPRWLDDTQLPVRTVLPGVYDLSLMTYTARLIVPREVELIPRNTLWHLYSDVRDRVQYGIERLAPKDSSLYNVVPQLIEHYGFQDMYTKEDFIRETLSRFTPKQRLEGLPTKERLEGLPPEERLEGLLPEQRLAGMTPAEFLSRLPEEQRDAFRAALNLLSTTPTESRKREPSGK